MILIRGHKFVKSGDLLYNMGSSSNKYYDYLTKATGPISILSWIDEDISKYDLSKLEVFDKSLPITIIQHPNTGVLKKSEIIFNTIKKGDSFSFKLPLPYSIIGCFFAILLRKPFVIESGGDFKKSLWYHGGLSYKVVAYPLDLIVKIEHRFAKHIIYVSKNYLQKIYPSKARQIGCSDAIINKGAEEILEKRINRINNHKGSFILGLIGATHAEYRGHDTLIKAAANLIRKGYDVKVKFLGGGKADGKRIIVAKKEGIEDRVEFCGRLPHDQVLNWIDDIDILVMPTLVESLGRAVIEAMSRGCPVIGTYETALGEQIGSDCLVHARNEKEIVSVVERIIKYKDYASYCAYENFYRSMKYDCELTYSFRKDFYDEFYKIEGLK